MVYLSICLCHLQFLSSVSYSFWSTGLIVFGVQCLIVFGVQVLGKFTPRYFILFDVMVNVIVSLLSLSDLLLLVYRNATDFCVLIFLLFIFDCIRSSLLRVGIL